MKNSAETIGMSEQMPKTMLSFKSTIDVWNRNVERRPIVITLRAESLSIWSSSSNHRTTNSTPKSMWNFAKKKTGSGMESCEYSEL